MDYKYLNRTKKIALSQVNFKEYFEFYRDFICPYLYKYVLEDKTEKISVIVYLAVKENKKICVPVSLLVDRKNSFSKMKLKELKITERNIIKK